MRLQNFIGNFYGCPLTVFNINNGGRNESFTDYRGIMVLQISNYVYDEVVINIFIRGISIK